MCDSTFHCVFWRPHRVLKILGKHHWGHEETTLQVQFCGIWNDRKNTWIEWGTSKLNDATIILIFTTEWLISCVLTVRGLWSMTVYKILVYIIKNWTVKVAFLSSLACDFQATLPWMVLWDLNNKLTVIV